MKKNDFLIENMKRFEKSKNEFCYWYGGKGEKCSPQLLRNLSSLYPSIYSSRYISKCRKDIARGLKCIDCSGLVCQVYQIKNINTTSISKRYHETTFDKLKAGMILWKHGHVGLFVEKRGEKFITLESRGIDYDLNEFEYTKTEFVNHWKKILFDDSIDYSEDYSSHDVDEGYWYKVENKWKFHNTSLDFDIYGGYHRLNWSGGCDWFYFDEDGFCVMTDENGVVIYK